MKSLTLGFNSRGQPLQLDNEQRQSHMHVIGSSGSGKSKFLEHLMRQDIEHRQGFCLIDPHGSLYDAVLDWCSRRALKRKIIPLNLSRQDRIVAFNPFQRAPSGDISVQVDRRIKATLHAWGVTNTDQTPTLDRTLRLIYTVMIEHNLGLPQVAHLIDFNAKQIRAQLIENLSTPLIQHEWEELQILKAREWRDETLSARNRLFKLLASPTLQRFMGLPGHSINLSEIIEENSILLVNLAPSDHLSDENARVFGALLVNEFFECAMRRQTRPRPKPYYLYLDEFQNFVSPDIADMLDQIRKFGIFLVLAHQRFGQLDDNIIDAVLTNCRVKSVFGGLPVEAARRMAEELFIGKLDPMKIRAAIYQTKFWPQYSRDKVYTRGSGHTTSAAHSSSVGGGESSTTSSSVGDSTAYSYEDWFSLPQLAGTRTETNSSGRTSMSGRSSNWAESSTEGESYSESESVADVPIFIPVPFQELSNIQYMPLADQLHQMTAALKEQFPRHCFIKIQNEETQPLLVPMVEEPYIREEGKQWYLNYQLDQLKALPAAEVDRLLLDQEAALLLSATQPPGETVINIEPPKLPEPGSSHPKTAKQTATQPIWNRTGSENSGNPKTARLPNLTGEQGLHRKRGPKPDVENHAKVVSIVGSYGEPWTLDENLREICDRLDQQAVPIPKTWPMRADGKSRSWSRALENYPHLVVKAIKDRCKMAHAQATGTTSKLS